MLGACVFNKKCNRTDGSLVFLFFGGLGDFVIWLAAARELRVLYHKHHITLCCPKSFAALAAKTSYFDQIVPVHAHSIVSGSSIRSQWKLRNTLAHIECDTLFQFFYFEDHLASAIKARKKICISRRITSTLSQWITKCIYDETVPYDEHDEHTLLQQARYLKKLGWRGTILPQMLPHTKFNSQPKNKYFVIFPGSADPNRRWDIRKFAQSAMYVGRKYELTGYVCGSANEKELAQYIKNTCQNKVSILDKTGTTSVTELVEMIRGAQFIITNDTSAVHIAIGTHTPAVCIYGLWDVHKQVLPYPDFLNNPPLALCFVNKKCNGCSLNYSPECLECIHRTGRRLCIESVTFETVMNSIDVIISQYR